MKGIDLSNHNGGLIDWPALKAAGVEFAYCKASEGVTFVDGTFARNRSEAASAGVDFGAYHYARPDLNSPAAEAKHFAGVVGSLQKNELRPALDFEGMTGASAVPWTPDWARTFLVELERLLDVRPMLYSYPFFLQGMSQVGGFALLRQWPLWLADYGVNDGTEHDVKSAYGFRVVAHQYTSRGSVAALRGVDLNSAASANDLRESGDYLLWRDWVLAGRVVPKPVGLPNSIPVRWQDAADADLAGVMLYVGGETRGLLTQVNDLTTRCNLAEADAEQQKVLLAALRSDYAVVAAERNALSAKVTNALAALA